MSIVRGLFSDSVAIDLYGSKSLATGSMKEITLLDTSATGTPSSSVFVSSTSAEDLHIKVEGSAYTNTFTITSAATVVEGPKDIYLKTSTVDGTSASITDEMTAEQVAAALRATTLEGFTITGTGAEVIVTSNINSSTDAVDLELGTDVTLTFTEDPTAGVDDTLGTGAWTVELKGITTVGNISKEVISLNGQTQVESTLEYSSIIYVKVLTAGSANSNVGKIYVGTETATLGVPTTGYAMISIGYNTSTGCVYTVPSMFDSFIERIDFVNPTASEILTVRIMSDYTVVKEFKVGAGVSSIEFIYPVKVSGRVSLSAQSTSTTPTVTANISGLMVRK
jgi:hypothetical protein